MRYEDQFFDCAANVERLAQALGVCVPPPMIQAIFGRYCTDAVRAFARRLGDLPPERLTMVQSFMMDRVTQILSPHIGDMRIGKWRDLPGQARAELTRVFRPFLDRFGYPC